MKPHLRIEEAGLSELSGCLLLLLLLLLLLRWDETMPLWNRAANGPIVQSPDDT
jgi:hypothetical protein